MKVGFSTQLRKRLDDLRRAASDGVKLLDVIPGTMTSETVIHAQCHPFRIHHEWYEDTPEFRTVLRKWFLLPRQVL